MSSLGILPYLFVFIIIFWVFVIRPQNRRNREAMALRDQLEVGSEVMLTSGVFGRVSEIDDDAVHVEVAPGVTIRVIRAAVARIIPQDTDEPDTESDTDDTPEIEAGNDAGPEEK